MSFHYFYAEDLFIYRYPLEWKIKSRKQMVILPDLKLNSEVIKNHEYFISVRQWFFQLQNQYKISTNKFLYAKYP